MDRLVMLNKYQQIVERVGRYSPSSLNRATLSEVRLNDYEAWLGYSLPADYREFLRDYGGITARAIYPLKDERRNRESIFVFFDMHNPEQMERHGDPFELECVPTMRRVLAIEEDVEEVNYPPRELLMIGIDQGGNQIYLALAGLHPGKVFFWQNCEDIYFVADSFDEFMQSLQYPLD
jgi:hypothetical protein